MCYLVTWYLVTAALSSGALLLVYAVTRSV